jgi:hypothetical protein
LNTLGDDHALELASPFDGQDVGVGVTWGAKSLELALPFYFPGVSQSEIIPAT